MSTRGLKVAGGDRLGKTIVFAKNQQHAKFIAERFNVNYQHYKREAPERLSPDACAELSREVAGLPAELDPENEEAKRFDLLALNLQLTLLRAEPWFARLRDRAHSCTRRAPEPATNTRR